MFSIFCNLLLLRILDQALSLPCSSCSCGRTGTDAALLKCTGVLDPFGGWCRAVRFCEFWCLGTTLCSLKMLPGNILALLAREAVSPRILGLGVPRSACGS